MNSNIEPQHDPPPASSPDDVINKLDEIHLDSNNTIEDEDTPMTEASDKVTEASVDIPMSPAENLKHLQELKARLCVVAKNLNTQFEQALLDNDDVALETSSKKLSSVEERIRSLTSLIESESKLIQEPTTTNPAVSYNINNRYIPSKKLPKFNVDPTASALYQLTHRDGKNKNSSSNEPSLEMFLREFERLFRDYNVSIDENWLTHLQV
ncbi:uncharacterized protein RHIMIDRAFT_268478, partial [Rhizopus microsporus ATCC 52813]